MRMPHQQWSAAADWITLVTDDDETGQNWYSHYKRHETRWLMWAKEWTHQGGYEGRTCEGLSWGFSEDYGYILRATGEIAESLIDVLKHWPRDKYRCTRIDIRVDLRYDTPVFGVAQRVYDVHKDSIRPRFKLIKASDGKGETCYIGSGASEMFARIYDKSAEQKKEPGLIWRYEVVFRKGYAEQALDDVRFCALGKSYHVCLASVNKAWFGERTVDMPLNVKAGTAIKFISRETSVEKQLRWLREGVAPTLHRLIDNGLVDEVCEALGVASITGLRRQLDE